MRSWFGIALVAAALAGCGSHSEGSVKETRSATRVERCLDRFLQRADGVNADKKVLRRYIERAYCARFDRRGWVYEDGTLSIAAHTSAMCSSARAGEPTKTVPCGFDAAAGRLVLDCAILHHVRRNEVRKYVEKLQRRSSVECDDGTPPLELGARSP